MAVHLAAHIETAAVLSEEQIAQCGGRPELAQTKRSLYPFFFAAGSEDGIIARLVGADRASGRWGHPEAICA